MSFLYDIRKMYKFELFLVGCIQLNRKQLKTVCDVFSASSNILDDFGDGSGQAKTRSEFKKFRDYGLVGFGNRVGIVDHRKGKFV